MIHYIKARDTEDIRLNNMHNKLDKSARHIIENIWIDFDQLIQSFIIIRDQLCRIE